jgi:hypothetical protein
MQRNGWVGWAILDDQANAPYVITYQMRKDFILIVAVFHTTQDR